MRNQLIVASVIVSAILTSSCASLKEMLDQSPPAEQIITEIQSASPSLETKTVHFPAVRKYVRWDESRRGTSTYTAESGWVITGIKRTVYDQWQGGGYSMRKDAAGENSISLSELEEKHKQASAWVTELWKSEEEKQKISNEIDKAIESFRRQLQIVSSSHSKVHVDWEASGSDDWFDKKRGKIHAEFDIVLTRAPTPQKLDDYIETVRAALD